MGYGIGHVISTAGSKCIICGKRTSTYLSVSQYSKDAKNKLNTSLDIPVCDGEHYNIVSAQKEVLIGHVKSINAFLRKCKF